MRITFLGTGTSVGVPTIGCSCEVCTSSDPRDKRTRTGLLIEHEERRVQIDISADFRQQMLRERIDRLDAVMITHAHADHILGLDDLRPFTFRQGEIPVYASADTWRRVERVFYYIFSPPPNYVGGGLPRIRQMIIDKMITDGTFEVIGLRVTPVPVIHGNMEVTAFRISDGRVEMAFITDCNLIPDSSLALLEGLDLLIIDALRYKPHTTHLHLDQTLAYIDRLRPGRALLTHMGHNFKHAVTSSHLPSGVEMAWDGLQVVI
jgi:phosphoribosyl 1,2-cyclic phosphate phosphodiesterase